MVDAIKDKMLILLGVLACYALQLRSRSIYMHHPVEIGVHNARPVGARPATRDQASCHRLKQNLKRLAVLEVMSRQLVLGAEWLDCE